MKTRIPGLCGILTLILICGVVDGVSPAQVFVTLHSFDGHEGADSLASLVQGTDGSLYGTTLFGGTQSCVDSSGADVGCGTVFVITPSGNLKRISSFTTTGADGV